MTENPTTIVADMAEADRARAYDAWYETVLGAAAHRVELRSIEAAAAPAPGEHALDVGCGTGIYTARLVELGLEVTGLDSDPAMLAVALAKAPQARFVQGEATSLPFAVDAFDFAVAVTLFCFLDGTQRAAAAGELLRVVRPGGRVVVGELSRYSLWAVQRRIKGWRGSATWRSARFTTAAELRRIFREAGATSVQTRYGLYLPPWSASAFVRRAESIERLGRPLGAIGAGFVVARAETDRSRQARAGSGRP